MKKYLNTIKIFGSVLFLLLIFNACTMLPTPPNSELVYGNIQVYSEPPNASIYLNGFATGYKSPTLLNNLRPGSYLITLIKEGYLGSSNFVQVYPNQTAQLNIALTPNPYITSPDSSLLKIEAKPDTFQLPIGESAFISSIIAYYSDDTTKLLTAEQCDIYSTEPNTARVTPDGQIIALSEGQSTIWIEYTESNITKSDSILVSIYSSTEGQGNLIGISVLPKNISLEIGETKAISSITAHYEDKADRLVSPYLCHFYANNSLVTIDNYGEITGIEEGNATVTISYSEGSITKTDTILVIIDSTTVKNPTYRSLSIGIGDYIHYGVEGDLLAPPHDVNKITQIYADCRFGSQNKTFQKIDTLVNHQATKTNIFNKIVSTFSGSNEDDVSYFYFSGHGALLNQNSFLCPVDFDGNVATAISVNELEAALSVIPGKKVVFIDSCHSGGFIGKDISRNVENDQLNDYLTNFNENLISVFTDKILAKDFLTSSEYMVLASSHWYQSSYELDPPNAEPFGVFSQALYEGCSLSNNIPADFNQDDKITLQEAYKFISNWVASIRINQSVQVYPANSLFAIFEY